MADIERFVAEEERLHLAHIHKNLKEAHEKHPGSIIRLWLYGDDIAGLVPDNTSGEVIDWDYYN